MFFSPYFKFSSVAANRVRSARAQIVSKARSLVEVSSSKVETQFYQLKKKRGNPNAEWLLSKDGCR
jgi:hypothetical protein